MIGLLHSAVVPKYLRCAGLAFINSTCIRSSLSALRRYVILTCHIVFCATNIHLHREKQKIIPSSVLNINAVGAEYGALGSDEHSNKYSHPSGLVGASRVLEKSIQYDEDKKDTNTRVNRVISRRLASHRTVYV